MEVMVEREEAKMTIAVATGTAEEKGKKFFVDGVKMSKGQVEIVTRSYIQMAIETGATVEIDTRLANEFKAITETPYNGEFELVYVDENGKTVEVGSENQNMFAAEVDATPHNVKITMHGETSPMFEILIDGRHLIGKRGSCTLSQRETNEWIIKAYQQRKQYPNMSIEIPEVVAALYLDSFACNPRFIRELNVTLTGFKMADGTICGGNRVEEISGVSGSTDSNIEESKNADLTKEEAKMTIEMKIAKNGAKLYYRVDENGNKTRVAYKDCYMELAWQAHDNFEAECEANRKAQIDVIDDYAVNPDAFDIAVNAEIERANTPEADHITGLKEESQMTTNMQLAAQIVESLGNVIVKFANAGEGNNGGLALHYDTYHDENDEFGTPIHFVEVFTDKTSYILHHVNIIDVAQGKRVKQYFFDTNTSIKAQAGLKEENFMTDKLIISAKWNKNDKITAYYINGEKVRKCDIEYYACNHSGIIEVDYHLAQHFRALKYPGEQRKVVYTDYYGQTLMSKAAADELGYKIVKNNSLEIFYVEPIQTDNPDDSSNDEEPDLIVETKRTKRDSINLKLNGKRISLRNLEDQVENSSYFSVINQYGKEYSCYPATTYGYFGESPEGYTIHFNTLGELIEHYAVDNIIHTAEPADQPTNDPPADNRHDTEEPADNPTNDTQDTDPPIDPPVYNPFTIEEDIDSLNHNINWATETLTTMQGDIYSDDWQDWTRSELQQAIEDWTEERDDLIIKSGKLTFNHQQKKNLRDSLNRAIKQCIRNRIGYRKSYNPKMEKYEYELLCLLQGARRELEIA